MKVQGTIEAIYAHLSNLGYTVKQVESVDCCAEAGGACYWEERIIELTRANDAMLLHECVHVAQGFNNGLPLGRLLKSEYRSEAIQTTLENPIYNEVEEEEELELEYEAYSFQYWYEEQPEEALLWLDYQLGKLYA